MIVPADTVSRIRRPVDTDLSDMTTATPAGPPAWCEDGSLEIPFEQEPTQAEQDRIIRRLLTASTDEEAWVGKLLDARASLAKDTSAVASVLRLLVDDRLGSFLP